MTTLSPKLVFLWNNFGPMHADRVDAVASHFPGADCVGLELFATDVTYDWESESRASFHKITLHGPGATPGRMARVRALLAAARRHRGASWYLCHYERPEILVLALWLRLTGQRVHAMGCSKFDDMERGSFREWLKSFFLRPYHGAIGSAERSTGYFRFLGLRRRPVAAPYNTLSIARMRTQAEEDGALPAPAFADRDWIIVARLVPKKNLAMALEAFALYRRDGGSRGLHICGNGPLEAELRARAAELGIADHVTFHGFVQSTEISRWLARSMALILPSIEEQFGNVVIEAQALGLPVLLSNLAGAADTLLRNWQNGFVFEPDNPQGLAGFMGLLDRNEELWQRFSATALETAPKGDVAAFAEAVATMEAATGGAR